MAAPGDIVAGNRLVERLGEGHFGEVWAAEYAGQRVALKIFTRAYRVSQIRRETVAQYALGRLAPPDGRWFPRVEHIDLESRPPYMRMELIDGRPLDEAIDRPDLSLDDRLALAAEILRALTVVHRNGFVHGDLSPSNILVRGSEIRMIDVGFGALFDDEADVSVSTSSDRPYGVASPLYASPERFRSDFLNGCGPASDVFSFGKILYRVVTRESPYVVKPLTRKYAQLDPAWDEFLFRCLEEDPAKRFRSAAEALAEFEALRASPAAPRTYRAECPACYGSIEAAVARPGEVVACGRCGSRVEFLNLDPATGRAECGCVACVEATVVPDEPIDVRNAVKFCPACGGKIRLAARKCRHCHRWLEEFDRRYRVPRRPTWPDPPVMNYWLHTLATLLAYTLCWLPGALLNLHFLAEANQAEARTGVKPAGAGGLEFLLWIFVYLPIILLLAIIVYGMLGALIR